MGIGNRLSVLLEKRETNPNELAKKVGVSPQTIYSIIKRDSKKADIEVLLKIADTLGVSVEYFIDDVSPVESIRSDVPSSSDIKLLKKYHCLDEHGKELVDLVLDKEHERCIASITEKPAALRIYTYMQKIAAAGNGFYFDDIPTETIEAPYMPGADFIIGVSGDSMEPTYSDGDLVYVEKRQIIHSGEIGIFMIHNECYIKEVTDEGLKSHNPKYELIPGDESIQCIGKVLGKVDMSA